ncbi:uncharacterized protein LOC144143217 [Haemaphysalis longicornis]
MVWLGLEDVGLFYNSAVKQHIVIAWRSEAEREQRCLVRPTAEPGETSLYPRILFSGQTAEKSGAVTVHFEELQLTAMDIVDGFALLLAVYWTFNIQYAPKTKRTCLLF